MRPRSAPRPAARPPQVKKPQAAPRQVGRLRERRQKERKTARIVLTAFFSLLVLAALIVLWRPGMRIQEIHAEGPGAERMQDVARDSVRGTYLFLIPRDSIIFFPKDTMRARVLEAFPEAAAVSISRSSFTSVTVKAVPRTKAFIWCGMTIDTGYPDGGCFEADAEGLIFKPAEVSTSTVVLSVASGTPMNAGDLRIFSPLDRELVEGQTPVGARVTNSAAVPNALRFVKAIRSLGVPVSSLAIRGDEADLWLNGPTRITYVLGHEEEAAQLAASVIPGLELTDGTIQYLDLRFSGKAYVKRYGDE